MIGLLGLTLLLWARDLSSLIILSCLIIMYSLLLSKKSWLSVKWLFQLVGMFVMLDAIRSPLYLIDGRDLGDGANLASHTWLPEFFWVAIWFFLAVANLYFLWMLSTRDTAKQ